MTITNTAKKSQTRRVRSRHVIRLGAAASSLAVILACGVTGTAVGAPNAPGQLDVEGQLLPVDGSPGLYRVTGGLIGTYKLRTERVINSWTYWTTKIDYIEGTESLTGCVDQNQNQSCDANEPSSDLRLKFSRVANLDTSTGRLIESRTHQVYSSDRFSSGLLTMRDLPVGGSDEIVSIYEGDLKVTEVVVDSKQAG
jgi:hypothetical protein